MPVKATGPAEDILFIGSWFSIEIDGHVSDPAKGYFTEASGLAVEMEVVEWTDSSKDTRSRKRPGTAKYGDITLKRPLSPDKTFWTWAKSIRDGGKDFRAAGSIVMFDIAGTEVSRWEFDAAWPSKWSASDLDVGTDDVMTEEVTLAVEMLSRVK